MPRPSLMNLTLEYFRRRGYLIEQKGGKESDKIPEFDMVAKKLKNAHPVRVKEWNRTVGVNIVISLDRACKSGRFSTPILVAEKFSEHARAYANRRGIILITKSEMIRSLR